MRSNLPFYISILAWTVVLSISLLWNFFSVDRSTQQLMKSIGQSFFLKIETTRLWNASHGGVYVPVSETTRPNPYLEDTRREIRTVDGTLYTKINPAYMTRQIAELAQKHNDIKYHVMSLQPIRPQNMPDEWERMALERFKTKNDELLEYLETDNVYKYIAPLMVEPACMKCHEKQGYVVGDIRGGISVTIPAPVYRDAAYEAKVNLFIIHAAFLILAIVGSYAFKRYRDHQLVVIEKKQGELEEEINQRRKAEEQIQTNLKEKETLLKEIHHRVKNNMSVVSSLLSLHRNSTHNEEVKKALQESQGRVYAMSAVHESLYNSKNLAEIDLIDYLNKLSTSLLQTYSVRPGKIELIVDGDNVKVNIDKASPLGLTVNELISNALKYAFPDDRKGEILLKLALQDTRLELIIKDNGIGMPDGFDWRNSSSLGLKLVQSLIENQLGGSIELDNTDGTLFTVILDLEN